MWTSGETHTIHQHLQADPGMRMRPGEAPVSAAGNWWHQLQREEHRTWHTVPSVGKGHCLVEEQGVPNFYNHHFQPLTVLHIKGFSLVLINCMKLCFSLEKYANVYTFSLLNANTLLSPSVAGAKKKTREASLELSLLILQTFQELHNLTATNNLSQLMEDPGDPAGDFCFPGGLMLRLVSKSKGHFSPEGSSRLQHI